MSADLKTLSLIGFSALNVLIDPNTLSAPKDNQLTDVYFNVGGFQLPIYYGVPLFDQFDFFQSLPQYERWAIS